MWGSIPALETLASIAFWVTLAAGMVAVAAGAALTVTTDRIAALTKRDADIRITEADARAAEANARAEEAKAQAGSVNERLQKAQKTRRVSSRQAEHLLKALGSDTFRQGCAPKLGVGSISDAEATRFAADFLTLLKAADVDVFPTPGGHDPVPINQTAADETGLAIYVPATHGDRIAPTAWLAGQMKEQGLEVAFTVTSSPPSSFWVDRPMLYVLRKPPV